MPEGPCAIPITAADPGQTESASARGGQQGGHQYRLEFFYKTASSCTSSISTWTRSDVLPGGASFSAITVAVNVAPDAPTQATNQLTLSGGGSTPPLGVRDIANIMPAAATVATVSAASGTAPVAPDSIVSLYAANIASGVFAATAGPPVLLPAILGGVSATITDSAGKTAPLGLIVVTPNQVNAVLPAGRKPVRPPSIWSPARARRLESTSS